MCTQCRSNKHCIFKGSGTTYVNEKFLWWAGIHKTLHVKMFISKQKKLSSSKYIQPPNNWNHLKVNVKMVL